MADSDRVDPDVVRPTIGVLKPRKRCANRDLGAEVEPPVTVDTTRRFARLLKRAFCIVGNDKSASKSSTSPNGVTSLPGDMETADDNDLILMLIDFKLRLDAAESSRNAMKSSLRVVEQKLSYYEAEKLVWKDLSPFRDPRNPYFPTASLWNYIPCVSPTNLFNSMDLNFSTPLVKTILSSKHHSGGRGSGSRKRTNSSACVGKWGRQKGHKPALSIVRQLGLSFDSSMMYDPAISAYHPSLAQPFLAWYTEDGKFESNESIQLPIEMTTCFLYFEILPRERLLFG